MSQSTYLPVNTVNAFFSLLFLRHHQILITMNPPILLFSVDEVHAALSKMSQWARNGAFPGMSKENSWGKFNQNVLGIKVNIDGLSPHVITLLCIRVFTAFLARKWTRINQNKTLATAMERKLDRRDFEVLAYIAGYIVRKLKYRYLRTKKPGKQCIVELLATNSNDPAVQYAKLIETKDRGGLFYVKQSMVELLAVVECRFRDFCRGSEFSIQKFISECVPVCEDDFLFCIEDSGETNELSEADMHSVLCDVLRLFSKIRIHHRCKVLSEKVKGTKKSLRKGLKKQSE